MTTLEAIRGIVDAEEVKTDVLLDVEDTIDYDCWWRDVPNRDCVEAWRSATDAQRRGAVREFLREVFA